MAGGIQKAGIRLTVEGKSQYLADLRAINNEMKLMALNSQLALAKLGNHASVTDKYKANIKGLSSQLEIQKSKYKNLERAEKELTESQTKLTKEVESAKKKFESSSKATADLKNKYESLKQSSGKNAEETKKANKAYRESLEETNKLKKNYNNLSESLNKNSKQLSKMPIDLAKAELATVKLNNEIQKAQENYRNSGGWLADTSDKFFKIGQTSGNIAQKLSNLGDKTRGLSIGIVGGLTGATKAYMDFEGQQNTIRSLLRDSYTDTKQLEQATNSLTKSSQDLGMQYGESSSKIRDGMAELIKKGFSANATLGATPAILKASIASGDDFNSVMETSSSVLTQFGLVTDDTNKMLSNTEMVTSTLTFVANKTSAGFSDLGEAMQNVGPIAHSNSQSVQDMASALGIMSNAGIKGGEAGTYLANVLRNLATPTKAQKQALQELGVSAYDSSGKMRPLPDILDDIATATEGLSEEEKANVLSKIFNQRAIKGALPLLQQGKGAIRELSEETGKAVEYQNKLAEEMGNTGERQLMKFKENVMALAVSFGREALPYLLDFTEKLKGIVKGFSSLDKSTKDFIVKMGLGVAAIYPVSKGLSTVFSAFSMVNNGIGTLTKSFGKFSTAKATGEITKLAGGAVDAGEKVAGLAGAGKVAGAGAISFSNPWTAALTGVLALAGVVAYELARPNLAHIDSVRKTEGAYADWFETIRDGERAFAELEKSHGKATEEAEKDLEERLERLKKRNQEVNDMAEANAGKAGKFKNFFHGSGSQLNIKGQERIAVNENISSRLRDLGMTKEETQAITDRYQAMAIQLGNSFNEIGKIFNSNRVVTAEWASGQIQAVEGVSKTTTENLENLRQEKIKDIENQVNINAKSRAEADKEIQEINKSYDQKVRAVQKAQESINTILSTAARENRELTEAEAVSLLKSYQTLAEGTGKSMSDMADVQKLLGENLSAFTGQMGLDFLATAGIIDDATATAVLNAETGAEKVEILKKALEDYNEFEVSDKEMEIKASGEEKVKKLIDEIGYFNELSPENKELVTNAKNPEELEQLLVSLDLWDNLSPAEKTLILNGEIADLTVQKAIADNDLWNEKDFLPKFLEIDTNSEDAKQKVIDLVNEYLKLQNKDPISITAETYGVAESTSELDKFNQESGKMESKSVTASANCPGVPESTSNVNDLNKSMGQMEDKSVTAKSDTPNMPKNTSNVKDYNKSVKDMQNKSVSANTSTPNMPGNTNNINSFNRAVNAMRSKTVSITTRYISYHESYGRSHGGASGASHLVYGSAKGNHISAFASGGNIDMFASGGSAQNPKRGYMGIVGEAGPELFQVTRNGVNITPLSTREKMRGINGVLEDHSNSGDISFNIAINNPVVREDKDIEMIYEGIVKKIKSDTKFERIFNKGV